MMVADETEAMRRERLILQHVPQVHVIAHRLKRDGTSVEDLVSAGIVGLIAAVDKFEVARNLQLQTYAEFKIRGAMLDSLRAQE
jgi:RNA polymerase sigma factor FliA